MIPHTARRRALIKLVVASLPKYPNGTCAPVTITGLLMFSNANESAAQVYPMVLVPWRMTYASYWSYVSWIFCGERGPVFGNDVGAIDIKKFDDLRFNLDVPILFDRRHGSFDNSQKTVRIGLDRLDNRALCDIPGNRPAGEYNKKAFFVRRWP